MRYLFTGKHISMQVGILKQNSQLVPQSDQKAPLSNQVKENLNNCHLNYHSSRSWEKKSCFFCLFVFKFSAWTTYKEGTYKLPSARKSLLKFFIHYSAIVFYTTSLTDSDCYASDCPPLPSYSALQISKSRHWYSTFSMLSTSLHFPFATSAPISGSGSCTRPPPLTELPAPDPAPFYQRLKKCAEPCFQQCCSAVDPVCRILHHKNIL